jgi:hypothetical protein
MDEPALRARLEAFLQDLGFGEIAPTLAFARKREHSGVWTADLVHARGDAHMEIFVYDLVVEPAGIVDAEEERIALSELDSPLVPELLGDSLGSDLAILAVAAPPDAQRLRRFLEDGNTYTGSTLAYQPDVDRLIGADVAHEIDGRTALSCLMSLDRARALTDILQRLASAVEATADHPYVPVFLSVYQADMASDASVAIQSFADLPTGYDNLAVMTTLISRYAPLAAYPKLLTEVTAVALADRLFATVRAGHGLSATFSRAAGCCIHRDFVVPTGDLADVYFLTAGADLTAVHLRQMQIRDLANAIVLLTESTPPAAMDAALRAGIIAYNSTAARQLFELVGKIPDTGDTNGALKLATAMHQASSSDRE